MGPPAGKKKEGKREADPISESLSPGVLKKGT